MEEKCKHPYDPMSDEMIDDTYLWEEMLECFWTSKKDVYNTFFALRVLGAKLKVVDRKLLFLFGDEITKEIKTIAKKKYLFPNKDYIEVVMNKIGSKHSNKKELEEAPF